MSRFSFNDEFPEATLKNTLVAKTDAFDLHRNKVNKVYFNI